MAHHGDMTAPSLNLLAQIPDVVVESAHLIAKANDETLVGYKAITDSVADSNGIHLPVRWMVITDSGYYEVDLDGICVRAAVLHAFPEPVVESYCFVAGGLRWVFDPEAGWRCDHGEPEIGVEGSWDDFALYLGPNRTPLWYPNLDDWVTIVANHGEVES